MLVVKLLPLIVLAAIGLVEYLVAYVWHDGRTRKNRKARKALLLLLVLSIPVSIVATVIDDAEARKNEARLRELQSVAREDQQSRRTGLLTPANEEDPSHTCGAIPQSSAKLFFADGVVWGDSLGALVGRTFGNSVGLLMTPGDEVWRPNIEPGGFTISERPSGLLVNALVVRSDGRETARIVDNEFAINPNNYFRNVSRDSHEIVIKDSRDSTVLDVRFVNEKAVTVAGSFIVGNDLIEVGAKCMSINRTFDISKVCAGRTAKGLTSRMRPSCLE